MIHTGDIKLRIGYALLAYSPLKKQLEIRHWVVGTGYSLVLYHNQQLCTTRSEDFRDF